MANAGAIGALLRSLAQLERTVWPCGRGARHCICDGPTPTGNVWERRAGYFGGLCKQLCEKWRHHFYLQRRCWCVTYPLIPTPRLLLDVEK